MRAFLMLAEFLSIELLLNAQSTPWLTYWEYNPIDSAIDCNQSFSNPFVLFANWKKSEGALTNGIESWCCHCCASFSSFHGHRPLTSGSSSRIIQIFSRLSDFSAANLKSWTNSSTLCHVVIETISTTRFNTKCLHVCVATTDYPSLCQVLSYAPRHRHN